MTQSTRTFRVFVSSTFSDLKAERNALQERSTHAYGIYVSNTVRAFNRLTCAGG